MSRDSCIISSPSKYIPQNGTFGEYLLECLKKQDSRESIFIDAISGQVQTAGELLEKTIRTVHVLKNLGVKRNDVIAIICDSDIDYHIPMLTAFCMGVITILVNPGFSTGELRHVLQLSKPKIIFCCFSALKNVQIVVKEFHFIRSVLLMGRGSDCKSKTGVMHLNTLLNEQGGINIATFAPESFDTSNQVALILLSSGTTGLPKAVPLTHLNLRYCVDYLRDSRQFGLKPNDRVAAVLPFYHTFGLYVSFSAFCCETKIIILQKLRSDVYFENIEKYKVNKLHIVPSLLQMFAKQIGLGKYNLSSIEDILIAGSPLSNDDVSEARKCLPLVHFHELYGVTELGGAISFVEKFPKRNNYCVGSIIPNVTLKVWDSASQIALGCKEVGELCFKGPMMMSKYLGIPNSNNIIDEDGFYHTGDLGYYDKDGMLYVVDRIKDIIKYKGFQVSPVEIERIILLHPSVEDCAVIGVPDKKTGQVPRAFVVPKVDRRVTAQDIIQFVAERISAQKRLYGGVRFVDKIPKTATGKILRMELNQLSKL